MTHPLTKIRQAARDVLQPHFRHPIVLQRGGVLPNLPCVMIHINGRRSEAYGFAMVRHLVQLAICVCVQANAHAETTAEAMLGEIERVMAANPTLGLPEIELVSLNQLGMEWDLNGEVDTLFYQQTFTVTYFENLENA